MNHLLKLSFSLFIFSAVIFAQTNDRISLASTYPIEKLKKVIIPRDDWRPYPTYSNPDEFDRIPEAVRLAYIKAAQMELNTEWPLFPANVFLEYMRIGNRSNYENLSFGRREKLARLVLAELFEREGRFMDQIVNGIWAICEESFWGVPAHNKGRGLPDVEHPIVDLFAAETGALMAWIYYLLGPELDKINPLIAQRIILETDNRILTPYLEHNDWGWMGFNWRHRKGYMRPVNNWNPWINSNIITCALLMEKDPHRRLKILYKAMDSIDNFVLPYPSDGGCDEGPSYWTRAGASLFDCLELLYNASNGKINIFDQPLITNIGTFIYKACISYPYFINFADATAKITINAPIVYRYGKAIGDDTMMMFAAFIAQEQDLGDKIIRGRFGVLNRVLPALFTLPELLAMKPSQPFIKDVWFPDIQIMAARSRSGSHEGFYLAAKGGHNNESHNHNDVGNFIVYCNGRPVLIDAGAQTYTKKTFSRQRYELWNNQSAYHNLPTINGVMQRQGHEFKANRVQYIATKSRAQLILEIAAAYPKEAFVNSWRRHISLERNTRVSIIEDYKLSKFVKPIELNFLTALKTDISQPGKIVFTDEGIKSKKNYYLFYPDSKLESHIETIEIKDSRMRNSWGSELRRITLKKKDQSLQGQLLITIED